MMHRENYICVYIQFFQNYLKLQQTACVFKWDNAFFQSALFSVVKQFLFILYLIDVSRNFTVRSLKRNLEMKIY